MILLFSVFAEHLTVSSSDSSFKHNTYNNRMTNNTFTSSYYKFTKEEKDFCNMVRVFLNSGLGGAICSLGLVGNLISYFVLGKGRCSGPVATFLLRSLALTDNFFLTMWFMNFSLRDLLRYIGYNSWTWRYVRLYSYPMLYIAQSATIWMTVLIALTRFAAVCLPYFAKRTCTIGNVQVTVAVGYSLVVAYNLPRFFEVQLLDINGTAWVLDTNLGANTTYQFVYLEVLYYIFTFALPLFLLIVLNCRLLSAFREIERRRRRLRVTSRCQQDEANVTLVMIVVVAVFVACQGPGRLAQIIWSYNYGSCRAASFFIMEISTILEVVNSSANFFIYCVIRQQFRTTFIAVCCRRQVTCEGFSEPAHESIMLQVQSAEQRTDISCSHINTENKVRHSNEECRPFLINEDICNMPESDV